MKGARSEAGFTAIEMIVVMAIVGIAAALAVPSWRATQSNSRLRDAAGDVSDALAAARSRAIADVNPYVVYFSVNGDEDICGNALEDLQGNPVPILVLDDDNGNCCRTDFAAAAVDDDPDPAGTYVDGSTFHDAGNNATSWVAFRGDGIPVSFEDDACDLGAPGTGSGAIYLNNDRRDTAVVLTALGSVKVHSYEAVGGTWTD
jgi:prepilin-type N-terminal cleavage/methylation domain-containing protein